MVCRSDDARGARRANPRFLPAEDDAEAEERSPSRVTCNQHALFAPLARTVTPESEHRTGRAVRLGSGDECVVSVQGEPGAERRPRPDVARPNRSLFGPRTVLVTKDVRATRDAVLARRADQHPIAVERQRHPEPVFGMRVAPRELLLL